MDEMKKTAAVIVASDKGYAGQREDKSGPAAREILESAGYEVVDVSVLPDSRYMITGKLFEYCDREVNLIITSGGTGLSERDVTPEATRDVIEREVPGIATAILVNSLKITERAMLTRLTAGVRGKTLIVNLPGSPKAVKEDLEFILPTIEHGIEILTGRASECARED